MESWPNPHWSKHNVPPPSCPRGPQKKRKQETTVALNILSFFEKKKKERKGKKDPIPRKGKVL